MAAKAIGRTVASSLPADTPVARVVTPRVKTVSVKEKEPPKEQPDLVRVRATERGQYGLGLDIIIRNPGEVFWMATSAMRPWPLRAGEHEAPGRAIIETDKGQFELPSWVELVGENEAVPASAEHSKGHQTSFGVKDGEVL